MFPLRDVHRPSRAPTVSRVLVLLLISVFAWQIVEASRGHETELVRRWSVRPACVSSPWACGVDTSALAERPGEIVGRWLVPLLSAAFLHAGPLHLALNVWFLWVFGPGVEDRLGRLKYFGFYLACAIGASVAHILAQPHSSIPMVGASGAIAGVLGAHFILLPRSWILSFIPPIWIVPIPSLVFLGAVDRHSST
jgi:membrane associated rhomboid family serine protease